jgi:OTU domain-containing protein 6
MLQARRAADMEEQRQIAAREAIAMPDLSSQEQTAMQNLFEKYNLREESIRPDGNCLYAAVASQLNSTMPDKVKIP